MMDIFLSVWKCEVMFMSFEIPILDGNFEKQSWVCFSCDLMLIFECQFYQNFGSIWDILAQCSFLRNGGNTALWRFFKQTSFKIDGPCEPYFIVSSYYFEKFFKTVLRERTLKVLSIKTGHSLLLEFPFGWEIEAQCTFFWTFSYFCFVVHGNFVWFSWWRRIIITPVALDHDLHRYRHAKACNNLFIWFDTY